METPTYLPREIVSELDRFIVGQGEAKRAVAIALRNRWRRRQLDKALQEEIVPKNILMIGPTGCGKTEIARRLAKLAQAPFLKIEATKFTEVGYVGRDVESIVRDLVDVSIAMLKNNARKDVETKAESAAEEKLIIALTGEGASADTKSKFRQMLRRGELEDKEIEITVNEAPSAMLGQLDMPGQPPGRAVNFGDMLKSVFNKSGRKKRMTVSLARQALINDETEQLLDSDALAQDAIEHVENHGIVFIDEIDKICSRSDAGGSRSGDVSREGVQRDLLPLIEGTTVSTRYGPVKTDYILFIASGAFHVAKPADLLPELQGRLPIRVELSALSRDDMRRILTEPEHSLLKQYKALIGTEGVKIAFTEDAIDVLADLTADINERVENIGARRLHTVIEKLLEEISFTASDHSGTTQEINAAYVREHVEKLASRGDLSRFIL